MDGSGLKRSRPICGHSEGHRLRAKLPGYGMPLLNGYPEPVAFT